MGKPEASRSITVFRKPSEHDGRAAAQTREPLKNGGTRNLANPLWCFHGFRLCVIILTIFGVIMVFSSSSVNMIANGQSPWAQALKQGMYCVFGWS